MAMDTAFGDPNADRAFLGSNLSGRFILGASMGGRIGTGLMASSPLSYSNVNYLGPTSFGSIAASGGVGAGIGAGIGAIIGSPKKTLAGAGIGAAIGGIFGSTVGPAAGMVGYAASNREFFTQSPYANRSSATAAALNASGDIVLGMHNSRNGY